MKKLFSAAVLLLAAVAMADPLAMMKAENELKAKKREVLIRTIRLQEEISVSPKIFKDVAEEQLVPKYMVCSKNGKDELVEISAWEESLGQITLKKTKAAGTVPFPAEIEITEALSETSWKATLLSQKSITGALPHITVTVPAGTGLEPGQIIECYLRRQLYPVHELVSDEEAAAWRPATAKDFYLACKAGKTFLVKAPVFKFDCPACDGTGVDQRAYKKIQDEINKTKVSKKKSLSTDSAATRLRKAAQNKPKCKLCKGEKALTLDEFRQVTVATKK